MNDLFDWQADDRGVPLNDLERLMRALGELARMIEGLERAN